MCSVCVLILHLIRNKTIGIPNEIIPETVQMTNVVVSNVVFLLLGALITKFLINAFDVESKVALAYAKLGDYAAVFVIVMIVHVLNLSVVTNTIGARRLAHVDRCAS